MSHNHEHEELLKKEKEIYREHEELLKKEKEIYRELEAYPGESLKPGKSNLELFHDQISRKIGQILKRKDSISISSDMIEKFGDHFKKTYTDSMNTLEDKRIHSYGWDLYRDFYQTGVYLDYLDELLYLGIWDDGLTNDPKGKRSAVGPLFLLIQKYKGQLPVGIIQAAEQQLLHPHKKFLNDAQELANEIYCQYLEFLEPEKINEEDHECQRPPVVQLCNCGASALLCGLPTPGFILLDEKLSDKFSGFSPLPHECGHVLANTRPGEEMLKKIKHNINLRLPHNHVHIRKCWDAWLEECFADAMGIAIVKEAAIFSLAHLFSHETTNKVVLNRTDDFLELDPHPNRHIRILLALEIAEKLGIKATPFNTEENEILPMNILGRLKKEWKKLGYLVNKNKIEIEKEFKDSAKHPPNSDVIKESEKFGLPTMKELEDSIKLIADAIACTCFNMCDQCNDDDSINLIKFHEKFHKDPTSPGAKLARKLKHKIERDLNEEAVRNLYRDTYET